MIGKLVATYNGKYKGIIISKNEFTHYTIYWITDKTHISYISNNIKIFIKYFKDLP